MPLLPDAIILVLAPLAPLFSHRVWLHAQRLLLGAIRTPGARTVTAAVRAQTADFTYEGATLVARAGAEVSATPPHDSPGSIERGDCLGADVYATGLRHGPVDFVLTLVDGGIAFDVEIYDVVVDLRVDYRVACIDASSTGTATMSRVHVTGVLALRAEWSNADPAGPRV